MGYSKDKIIAISVAGVMCLVMLCVLLFSETIDYLGSVYDDTVVSYVKFQDEYPDSDYNDKVEERKKPLEEPYFNQKKKRNNLRAYEEFLHAFPAGKFTQEATRLRDSIVEAQMDIEKYGNNVLEHGSLPYKNFYGENQKPKKRANSDIEVTAPVAFDMVAIVRLGSDSGKVVSHAFIQADSTHTFRVENGKYQLFFYIGKGWKPTKKMENGVEGGFVKNETFSKDDPVSLSNEVITYQLSMRQKNRKFKTSSRREVFR